MSLRELGDGLNITSVLGWTGLGNKTLIPVCQVDGDRPKFLFHPIYMGPSNKISLKCTVFILTELKLDYKFPYRAGGIKI